MIIKGELDNGAKSGFAQSWLAVILFGLSGLVLVVGPSVTNGRIPGDLGDARFNAYLLEHFYRWITNQDRSFWSADFFYPFPLTIAFSDNYLGSGLVYAFARAVHLDRENAFRLWFVTGFVINFVAAEYAVVRLGYSRLSATLGAFLFTFGLPMMGQESHAQLVYRFGVPLAVLALVSFSRSRDLHQLGLVAFWTTWQFYCSIYIGYFLTLLLGALGISQILCREVGPIAAIRSLPSEAFQVWHRASIRVRAVFLLTLTAMLGLMVVLGKPYIEASRLYNFHRHWPEIATMLPRPVSYLLANDSRLWSSSGPLFNALPMRNEHAMFIGIAPFLAIVAMAILRLAKRATVDRLVVPVTLAILLLAILTLSLHGHSAYRILAGLPGVDSVRAIARIIMVMLFPFGILLASSIDAIITASLPGWARSSIVGMIAVVLVFEASYITHYAFPESEWQARMAAVAAEVPPTVPADPILLLAPVAGEPRYLRELDAMLFAQDRGWRTLNGYSGNLPPKHQIMGLCQDIPLNLVMGLQIVDGTAEQNYTDSVRRVLPVGYPPCDEALTLPHRAGVTLFAGAVPEELMAKLVLRIERLEVRAGLVYITAAITNGSSFNLPAGSATDTPIRLSARFINVRGGPSPGWDLRQDLAIDIPPGETQHVEIPIAPPATPGKYWVELSMVQEAVAWFHDHGMPIPRSTQAVVVVVDARVSDGDH
jgi:hypothetical protein